MTIEAKELQTRIDAAKALQSASKGSNGANLQGARVYEYLKIHGSISSNNPLLAQLNPKYPTDAVWTNCAVKMRDLIAADGYVIIATGRKPTVYRLVALPNVTPAFAIGAVQAKPDAKPAATK